jgi:hypothetical protein
VRLIFGRDGMEDAATLAAYLHTCARSDPVLLPDE